VQVRTYSPVTKEIRSPITRGDHPLQDPKLEEFTFDLQAAPGEEGRLATNPSAKPLSTTSSGSENAVEDPGEHIRLNGRGQLVIDANDAKGYGQLDAGLVQGRDKLSVEVWVTPTADTYGWNNVFSFGDMQGGIWYAFRTLSVHRAEISVGGHNEDIQNKGVAVEVGRPLHIVWTYDQTAGDGKPLLSCFRNGKLCGTLQTGINLSELKMHHGRIGPFAGVFDELRIYDYPLNAEEVEGSFAAGPDEVNIEK
jgi:hypothetical protein